MCTEDEIHVWAGGLHEVYASFMSHLSPQKAKLKWDFSGSREFALALCTRMNFIRVPVLGIKGLTQSLLKLMERLPVTSKSFGGVLERTFHFPTILLRKLKDP